MSRKIAAIAFIVAFIATIILGALYWFSNQKIDVASVVSKPRFVFDQSSAPGWWSAGNNWPNIQDFTGDQVTEADLPVADINAHKGTKDKPEGCFVMAFYKNESVNITETLKKREADMTAGGKDPSILTQVSIEKQFMRTPEGIKNYELYQYDLNKSQIQRGNEFGFIPLRDGHIEVRGVCATADQLPQTLVGLSAIKLEPAPAR